MTLVLGPRLAGLVVAALAAAAGLVGLSSAPAAAALCSGTGVNVVVDFNGLGGGVQKGCDPNGAGRTANNVFPAAGFALTYAQRQPGFVCRVKGSPSSDPCVNTSPANATWGLYWSDGKSGTWHYSSIGVGGLKVGDGGFLAFSWQNGGAADPPSATPTNNLPTPPKPTKTTTAPKPTKTPTKGLGGGSSRPTRTPKPTRAAVASSATSSAGPRGVASARASAGDPARNSASARASASASPSAEPSPSDAATPEATATEKVNSAFAPEEEHSGLPVWVPVGVIIVLAGAAGGTLWWRRRTGAA